MHIAIAITLLAGAVHVGLEWWKLRPFTLLSMARSALTVWLIYAAGWLIWHY